MNAEVVKAPQDGSKAFKPGAASRRADYLSGDETQSASSKSRFQDLFVVALFLLYHS